MRITLKITFLLSLSLNTTPSFAWGDLGHRTTGYIAETLLDAKGRALVNKIIGQEPLSEAAVWPDHVRSDERYDVFAPYHYVTIPEGFQYNNRPSEFFVSKDAHTLLSGWSTAFRNKDLSTTQKAVLFRYYIHLVGDVHQPLHVGNQSDRGANLCIVKVVDANNPKFERNTNLHSAWDDALVNHLKNEAEKYFESKGKKIRYFSGNHLGDYLIEDHKNNASQHGISLDRMKHEMV